MLNPFLLGVVAKYGASNNQLLAIDGQQFDFKQQGCIGRNDAAGATFTVGDRGRAGKLGGDGGSNWH